MWFFGKDKDKGKKDAGKTPQAATPASSGPATAGMSKAEKTQALMAQMRGLRAEIGEEELAKIVSKLKLEDLKKQFRNDIDNDPKKRARIIDELRFNMRDDD